MTRLRPFEPIFNERIRRGAPPIGNSPAYSTPVYEAYDTLTLNLGPSRYYPGDLLGVTGTPYDWLARAMGPLRFYPGSSLGTPVLQSYDELAQALLASRFYPGSSLGTPTITAYDSLTQSTGPTRFVPGYGYGTSPTPPKPPGLPDLVGLVGWSHAYWVYGDLQWDAYNVDDGPLTIWYDEIGGVDMTGTGIYDADNPSMNNAPSINGAALVQSSVTSTMQTLVAVVRLTSLGTNRWHDNQASGGGGRWVQGTFSGNWQIYFGGSAGQTVPADTSTHLTLTRQNASLDRMEVDGATIYGPGNYGTSALTRLNIVNSGAQLSFIGLHAGDPRADPGWASFTAGVNSVYGLSAV